MKKHIFVSILLMPILLTSTCLSSCSNLNEYQVTKEEFRKIIALEDEEFIQIEKKTYDESGSLEETRNDKYSPNISYSKYWFTSGIFYGEKYVKKDAATDTYTKIERTDPEGLWGEWEPASKGDFLTAKELGIQLVDIYEAALASTDFTFDNEKKCYSAWSIENEAGDKRGAEFYFWKKQLIKINILLNDALENDISLTYSNYQPVPPLL